MITITKHTQTSALVNQMKLLQVSSRLLVQDKFSIIYF